MITATSLCGKGVALVFRLGELVFVLVIKAKCLAEGNTGLDECLAEGRERSAVCLAFIVKVHQSADFIIAEALDDALRNKDSTVITLMIDESKRAVVDACGDVRYD